MKQGDGVDRAAGVPRTLGEAIKQGRAELDLSQRALAAKMTELGVPMDATAVTRLENNQREPRLSEGIALSRFLGFDLFLYAPAGFTQAGLVAQAVASYGRAARALSELIVDATQALGITDLMDQPRRGRKEVFNDLMDEIVRQTEHDDELWVDGHPVASWISDAKDWEIDGAKRVVQRLLTHLEVLDDDPAS